MTTAAVAALVVATIWLFIPPIEFSGNLQSPQNGGVEIKTEFQEFEYTPGAELSRGESSNPEDIPPNCQWSECALGTTLGRIICEKHGAGYIYKGRTWGSDCSWHSSKNLCCKANKNFRWTTKCWGSGWQPTYACSSEFGRGFVPSGKSKSCTSYGSKNYECGN